ncbi:MAG TPA: hypothetical protein VKD72_27055, partial [Gemmataceae bacterium]|nr:hypothetical protein [Gemmataceae bacterium]
MLAGPLNSCLVLSAEPLLDRRLIADIAATTGTFLRRVGGIVRTLTMVVDRGAARRTKFPIEVGLDPLLTKGTALVDELRHLMSPGRQLAGPSSFQRGPVVVSTVGDPNASIRLARAPDF